MNELASYAEDSRLPLPPGAALSIVDECKDVVITLIPRFCDAGHIGLGRLPLPFQST
jgi:hypothetical protein